MQRRNDSSPWMKWIVGLSILVIVLLIVVIVQRRPKPSDENPTNGSGSHTLSDPSRSDSSEQDGTDSNSPTTTTEQELNDGSSMDEAIAIASSNDLIHTLPAVYQDDGFQILHVLADDRIVLLNAKRLSIVDLNSGEEELVHTADFGLQAAANDRFIVYGEGGDEVFKLEVYTIGSGTWSVILEDQNGYFGFELDEDDVFYTTKVEALKYGKAIGPSLAYNLVSGDLRSTVDGPRTLGIGDLLKISDSDTELDWRYEENSPWYEAWRLDQGNTFAMKIEYMDIYRDLYRYQFYRLDDLKMEPVSDLLEGMRPEVLHTANLFVIDGHLFYSPLDSTWYDLSDALGSFEKIVAASRDGKRLYVIESNGSHRLVELEIQIP